MRVRWNSSPRDCAGRLRETGHVYDDFPSHAEKDLIARGYLSPVTEGTSEVVPPVAASPQPKPVPTRDDDKKE